MLVSEEIQQLKVADAKSVPVVVKEDASVYDAIVALFTEDVGTLFIVSEDGYLEGLFPVRICSRLLWAEAISIKYLSRL